ncbi:YeiH family putative sulfate export transporter [Endozoicomonas sp. SM1973]|uniref:YeiH family putative sulfate export transporter n=1 Tax=Spartinivicinus marinus TaxID=2994442 RepID=A0A853IGV0_9GAMM|nr:YeiH family protein [Spartinivicinus marinus]MCX4028177.1 YeiH family protein [Spartinivicinus marinus]NYZ68375.1 YeiH family putative sulfate export transporter [Spartinivicinus marinus]
MPVVILLPLLAIAAIGLAQISFFSQLGLSALPLAIILGTTIGHLPQHQPDSRELLFIKFCQQQLLRLGIILFGFSLSFQQIAAVGWQALVLDVFIILIIFCIGSLIGIKLFKLPRDMAILTSVGSAICGAAAILATETSIKARQQHVTIAVATVVLFGTLAMFSYPFIYQFSGISEQAFGIYIGSTAHEVAQAIAAGQTISQNTMQTAVVVKLIRVMLLAPFILMLTMVLKLDKTASEDNSSKAKVTIPWFVIGFIIAAGINSYIEIPQPILKIISFISQFLLAIAMAALGMQTQWKVIKSVGSKPILLGFILFILLLSGGFYLNYLLING